MKKKHVPIFYLKFRYPDIQANFNLFRKILFYVSQTEMSRDLCGYCLYNVTLVIMLMFTSRAYRLFTQIKVWVQFTWSSGPKPRLVRTVHFHRCVSVSNVYMCFCDP